MASSLLRAASLRSISRGLLSLISMAGGAAFFERARGIPRRPTGSGVLSTAELEESWHLGRGISSRQWHRVNGGKYQRGGKSKRV